MKVSMLIISPWAGEAKVPLFAKENNSAFTYFIDGIPKEVPVRGYISVSAVRSSHVDYCSYLSLGRASRRIAQGRGSWVWESRARQTSTWTE